MRWITLLSCLMLTPLGAADEPKDQLLAAELLELTEGDLTGAMAVYEQLYGNAEVDEDLRARALLNLARCQRKAGALTQARDLLSQLLASFEGPKRIVKQAQGFLRELEEGKSANPDFDWLERMRDTPEIQAKIFQQCMDLVDSDSPEGRTAAKQLVALGTLATPMIERLLENSGDVAHRAQLAMTLLQIGRFEHIETVLLKGNETSPALMRRYATFLESIPHLSQKQNRAAQRALSATSDSRTEPSLCAVVRLHLGYYTEDVERDVELAEQLHTRFSRMSWALEQAEATRTVRAVLPPQLLEQLAKNPNARPAIVSRALASKTYHVLHLEALHRTGPLPDELLALALDRGGIELATPMIDRALSQHPDRLLEISRSGHSSWNIERYFRNHYTAHPATEPAAIWGELLYNVHAPHQLFYGALRSDRVLPWFLKYIEQSREFQQRENGRLVYMTKTGWTPALLETPAELAPSRQFLSAMEQLLETGDRNARFFALRFLIQKEYPLTDADLAHVLELVVEWGDEPIHTDQGRDQTIDAVFELLSDEVSTGGVNSEAAIRFFGRVAGADDDGIQGYVRRNFKRIFKSPEADVERLLEGLQGILANPSVPPSPKSDLLREVLQVLKSPRHVEVVRKFLLNVSQYEIEESAWRIAPSAAQWARSVNTPEAYDVMRTICLSDKTLLSPAAIVDSLARSGATATIVKWTDPKAHVVATDAPYPFLFGDRDRTGQAILRRIHSEYSEQEQDEFFFLVQKCPDAEVRRWFVSQPFIWEKHPGGWLPWLADKDFYVRDVACQAICAQTDAAALPEVLQVLAQPEVELKLLAIEALTSFASLETLEPLGEVLDTATDSRLRTATMDALESIQETQRKTEQWRRAIRELKGDMQRSKRERE